MLQGKTALITGAGRGIGRAIALELARAGANIAVNDYNLPEETVALVCNEGVKSKGYAADVSDCQAVAAMVDQVKKDFGSIDILINNAGISPKHEGRKHHIYEMDPEEWKKVVDINLNGVFYCTRYVAPIMMANKWGRIVNLSSMAARVFSPVAGIHYCATKTAVLGFTRVSAGELAPYNIIVNAVAPGRIDSEMTRAAGEEANKAILSTIPLNKYGTVEDVAKTIKFLVSEENGYIVGATIDINGGRAMV